MTRPSGGIGQGRWKSRTRAARCTPEIEHDHAVRGCGLAHPRSPNRGRERSLQQRTHLAPSGFASRWVKSQMAPIAIALSTTKGTENQEIPCGTGDFGGGQGRRRSVDLWFFRPALYQLSYLTSHNHARTEVRAQYVAGATGFEPATSGLTGRRELQTSPRPRGAPKGIRIPVAALKGQSPRPLDDGGPKISGYYTVVTSKNRAS